jgi:3-phosphoshikimate 1-carboxyvinyltransferase
MSSIRVQGVKRFEAGFTMMGDKSISHRAMMLAGFAKGTSKVTGFLPSEDCLATLKAMQALGVEMEQLTETSYLVHGRGGNFLPPLDPIDCGNSGTTVRLLSGLVSNQPFKVKFIGDLSLSRRPMKRVIEPLSLMGAVFNCEGPGKTLPMWKEATVGLKSIEYRMPVASAQVKSAVLLGGLQAQGKSIVYELEKSRDHTERMLKHLGASLKVDNTEISIWGQTGLEANSIHIPGDFSSAAFWLVAAAAYPGSRLLLENVGLNPTRTGLLNVLVRMGAKFQEDLVENSFEPYGSIKIIEGGNLRCTEIGGKEIPNVIDELPIIAVAGALAKGTTVIKDAKELRVKETDRIAALAKNLRAFGVDVEEREDGMIIEGGGEITAATVSSFGDHRIAMAFSILGLFAKGTSIIEDTDCVATSYPLFEKHLGLVLGEQFKLIKRL